ELDVPDLAANRRLADAEVDRVHEAAEDDDRGGAEAHGRQRDERAASVPEHVAERELQEEPHGSAPCGRRVPMREAALVVGGPDRRHGQSFLSSASIAWVSGAAGCARRPCSHTARASAILPAFL